MKIKTTRDGVTTGRIAKSWGVKAVGEPGEIVMLGFCGTFDDESVDVFIPLLPGHVMRLCEMLQLAMVTGDHDGVVAADGEDE